MIQSEKYQFYLIDFIYLILIHQNYFHLPKDNLNNIARVKMNKSFDMNSSASHYLPKINKINESTNLSKNKPTLYTDRYKAQSSTDINPNIPLTRKLVSMDDIKNVEEYDSMNEKQLLREHQKLLRVIKKFQQIIDIHLSRKKRQLRSNSTHSNKPSSTKEELLKCQIVNNKKIIENYQREVKDLESAKKQRKLNDVIQQRIQVQGEIAQLKKQIFNLKNDDNMAGRNLIENRPQIQKQLKEIEKDLKIQLTKKHEYVKRMDELNEQLNNLKKECQGINMNEITNQKSTTSNLLMKISIKKAELEEVRKQREQIEQTIQQNMVSKAKRNKGLRKEIQNSQKRMVEMNTKIQQHKEKISRYQKVMQILPKTAQDKLQQSSVSSSPNKNKAEVNFSQN